MIPLSHPLVQDYLRAARQLGVSSDLAQIHLNDRMQDAGVHGGIGTPDLIPPEVERGPYDMPMRSTWQAGEVRIDQTMIDRILSTL